MICQYVCRTYKQKTFSVFRSSGLFLAFLIIFFFQGCGAKENGTQAPKPVDVTTFTVMPKDVPIVGEFVGETESSHMVEIRARIQGFLEKRLYEEGTMVNKGDTLFEIDKKPFEASLQQAKGQLAQQKATLDNAKKTLDRVKPLAEQNAVSQKDLDDAMGYYQSAVAAVLGAQGAVREAELNLGYATIKSPVTGLSGDAKKQTGSYISSGEDSLLTYVAQINPIWVNFSISENEYLRMIEEIKKGTLIEPEANKYEVEIVLADGSVYPIRGHLIFADPSLSPETGTFMVRAEIENPQGLLRPSQFVRVRLHGAVRPQAVAIPRRAVLQGAKGFFVWIVDKDNTAQVRKVSLGRWLGDLVFINNGLLSGETIVVDGINKLAQGVPVKAVSDKQRETSNE